MILIILVMLFPLVHVLAKSLSDANYVARGEITIFPKGINGLGYRFLSTSNDIYIAYKNTIIYTTLNTLLTLTVGSMAAYALAHRGFFARNVFLVYITIPIFFSGGLIPFFLIVKALGLRNTMWSVILPPAFTASWYIILIRTNFQSLPVSLRESAFLDGAADPLIWLRIYLPLSKPILAAVGIFTAVGMWNAFWGPYIFLDDQVKWPLQIMLRRLLLEVTYQAMHFEIAQEEKEFFLEFGMVEVIKHAATIVTIGPIILVYPFFQKYFMKGILVGAIKA
jgi:putative aldouronate transport system permease protein